MSRDSTRSANVPHVTEAPRKYINTGQAAAIGVAAMVGAGIFSLLGTAGEVAGSAVWLSFVLAGVIARSRATRSGSSARATRRRADCSST